MGIILPKKEQQGSLQLISNKVTFKVQILCMFNKTNITFYIVFTIISPQENY